MGDIPATRYATTSDGVRIAYMRLPGEGRPWLWLRTPVGLPMEVMAMRGSLSRNRELAGKRPFVLFDWRGTGQSQRVFASSIDDLVADVAAVNATIEEPPDVLATNLSCFPACTFAAAEPGAWRSLVLADPMLRARDGPESVITRTGWQPDHIGYVRSLVRNFFPDINEDEVEPFARAWAEAVPAQAELAFREFVAAADLTDTLPRVPIPVLVSKAFPGSAAASVAPLLPNGVLVERELASGLSGLRDAWDATIGAGLEDAPAAHVSVPQEPPDLTTRQQEVLSLIAAGRSNREIAEQLTLSQRTVERHVENIFDRIGVNNRAEAVRWALEHGLG